MSDQILARSSINPTSKRELFERLKTILSVRSYKRWYISRSRATNWEQYTKFKRATNYFD